MNSLIINEFEKLIAFINDENTKIKDIKKISTNQFRIKQLKNVLLILKKYPKKIDLNNYEELSNIDGIGKGTIERIKEILNNGLLSELNNFIDTTKEKTKIIENLESVVGIGNVHAVELYNYGIKSVKDLKKKIKNNEIKVSDKIKLGLKYHGKFEGNIPRKETNNVYKLFKKIINKINKKLPEDEKYIFEICGSYRREKITSNDIDVLISKKGKIESNCLENIIKILKTNIIDDKPFLIDDITDKNIQTKYMGFAKYKDNPPRRVDIRFVPFEFYYSALLYFTGSAELNKKMRNIAKSKKLKLSEYGLFKENGDRLPINSERDVFDILGIEYLHPRLR